MTNEQKLREAAEFVRDACSRIKLAYGTADYDNVLHEELEDIESNVLAALDPLSP